MSRFGEAVERVKGMLESGEAGPPGLLVGKYYCNSLHAPWWREKEKSGGQIVDANGTVVADVSTETPEGINTRGRTFLSRVGPPEDPWRIIDQQRIGDVPA